MAMLIDWHSHHTPPGIIEELTRLDGKPRHTDELDTPDFAARVRALDAAGVDVQLIGPGAPFNLDAFAPEQALSAVRRCNDLMAEGVAAYPDRLLGLIAITPQDIPGSVQEVDRMADRGFRGVVLHPQCKGQFVLDRPEAEPLFAKLEERGLPAFLHGGGLAPDPTLAHLEDGGAGVSASARSDAAITECVVRLVASGVFDRHPGLHVVIRSAGGGLPLLLNKLKYKHTTPEGAHTTYAEVVQQHFLVDTAGANARTVAFLVDTLGDEHVVFGTDVGGGGRFERAVAAIEDQPDPGYVRSITESNSRRLLGI
jgi:predicted TIM-barrel fold metal-dependent hydrolase